MTVPVPTPIYRMTHVDNVALLLSRRAMHAPNFAPDDRLLYKSIHDQEIQGRRRDREIPCGPKGVIADYVGFYFGPRSPMLYRLSKGNVAGFKGGQGDVLYLVSNAQFIASTGAGFVFSDGHSIMSYTEWYEDLAHLDALDWNVIYAEIWNSTIEDMDRKRRKQAEFLVYRECPWRVITEIGVLDAKAKRTVEGVQAAFPPELRRPVNVRPEWYY
ncbi:MAG: DUF4433 domain-containing protein [Thermoanaerobaculia bacterium]|nr:DUF4433 domain-containing protein [Thermoanaerobaculia bacterium]